MMTALEAVLRRPRTIMTLMIVTIIAGVFAYILIPKEAQPDIDVPLYYISVTQQGVSPQDAERLIVRPLETHLRGIDGLKQITGIASEGHAAALLELDINTKLVQNIKLAEVATGIGTENVREPRLPLAGEERARVLEIIDSALKTRPVLPNYKEIQSIEQN